MRQQEEEAVRRKAQREADRERRRRELAGVRKNAVRSNVTNLG